MKAFHHSGTNLIYVWKSGPRTVVLSEKVKRCFICNFNSNFKSLLKLFRSYHFLDFFLYFSPFRHLPVNPHGSIFSSETQIYYLPYSINNHEDYGKKQILILKDFYPL